MAFYVRILIFRGWTLKISIFSWNGWPFTRRFMSISQRLKMNPKYINRRGSNRIKKYLNRT